MEPLSGIVGLLILIGDIWAIINVIKSTSEALNKILWVLLIIFLPLIGLIIWFFIGPRSTRS